jgi:hypothetical protein
VEVGETAPVVVPVEGSGSSRRPLFLADTATGLPPPPPEDSIAGAAERIIMLLAPVTAGLPMPRITTAA